MAPSRSSPRHLGPVLAIVVCLGLSAAGGAAGQASAPAHPARPSDMLAWTPEQQASGFRNVDKLFVTHTVKRGQAVHPLPKAPGQLEVKFAYKQLDYSTESYMAAQRVSGVLVLKHGRIILERYGLGRTPADRWTSFSVTKSITSSLVGAALRDGFIKSLDDPVSRYLPEMKGSAYDEVTVRQLLTMTSGVRWTETYGDPNSDVVRIGSATAPPGMDPIVGYLRGLPRVAPPGTQFHYKSGEADLAAILVSRAVGKPLADYLSEKIWKPFGMEQDAVWILDDAGFARGGCCLSMSLRDSARYGLFMLGGGQAGGRAVLPDGWVAAATRTEVATGGPGGGGYGYLWWTNADGSYQAVGIFGQLIQVIPAEDLVIVINAAWPTTGGRDYAGARAAFVAAVREAARAPP
jgi:CubicO group peptidase (beta-lactamase class C family)